MSWGVTWFGWVCSGGRHVNGISQPCHLVVVNTSSKAWCCWALSRDLVLLIVRQQQLLLYYCRGSWCGLLVFPSIWGQVTGISRVCLQSPECFHCSSSETSPALFSLFCTGTPLVCKTLLCVPAHEAMCKVWPVCGEADLTQAEVWTC